MTQKILRVVPNVETVTQLKHIAKSGFDFEPLSGDQGPGWILTFWKNLTPEKETAVDIILTGYYK